MARYKTFTLSLFSFTKLSLLLSLIHADLDGIVQINVKSSPYNAMGDGGYEVV